jgi:hypothetical protein
VCFCNILHTAAFIRPPAHGLRQLQRKGCVFVCVRARPRVHVCKRVPVSKCTLLLLQSEHTAYYKYIKAQQLNYHTCMYNTRTNKGEGKGKTAPLRHEST